MPATTMERELRFFPAAEDRPLTALTPQQLRGFNRDGFLHGVELFDAAEMHHHRAVFDALLAAYQARGHDSYSVNNCQATSASVYDLATHPRVVERVADLLGSQLACWSTHYFCKLPGDAKSVTWHQDAPYWPFTPSKTVTVWLAIDDADEGNGAMRVIPGSHLAGPLPMRDSRPDERNVLSYTVDGVERLGSPVPMVLRAGQAVMFSDLLLHSSPPNPSARRRCGVALRYCPLDVRSHSGWNRCSIVVRGTDPSGHWAGVTRRPQGEDPFTEGAFGAN